MGIFVGALTFLINRTGLLSITGPSGGITFPIMIYILAFLGGYQHNVITELVKRMLKVFKIGEPEEEPAEIVNVPPNDTIQTSSQETSSPDYRPDYR